MAVDPNHKTLRRRSRELKTAAAACPDEDAKALLLFYAAECILKAYYMKKFSLRSTGAENALAKSARHYSHRLDNILTVLHVNSTDCPRKPKVTRLKSGNLIDVGQLHEAWRYGEKIDDQNDVLNWLGQVITYAEARV